MMNPYECPCVGGDSSNCGSGYMHRGEPCTEHCITHYGPHSATLAPVLVLSNSGKSFRVCTNHLRFYLKIFDVVAAEPAPEDKLALLRAEHIKANFLRHGETVFALHCLEYWHGFHWHGFHWHAHRNEVQHGR